MLTKLTNLDRIVGGAALLFVVDLLFLPWIDVSFGIPGGGGVPGTSVSVTSAATSAPDGFLGILALLLGLAVLGDLLLDRLTEVKLPELPLPRPVLRLIAAAAAFALVALKFLLHPHPSYLGIGCWGGLVLGIAMSVGVFVANQAELPVAQS